MSCDITKLKFDDNGLIPAIVYDVDSNSVLMMAYMNEQSLLKTTTTGYTWFYSRSREELWNKGATSGNMQKVCAIKYDCDADCLLVSVKQKGVACHTGNYSCFNDTIWQAKDNLPAEIKNNLPDILNELFITINQRRISGDDKSYTKYLFMSGQDKILKKVGEEAAETIIASKNNDSKEVLYEMADLWYHCLVLLSYHNINPSELLGELSGRRK